MTIRKVGRHPKYYKPYVFPVEYISRFALIAENNGIDLLKLKNIINDYNDYIQEELMSASGDFKIGDVCTLRVKKVRRRRYSFTYKNKQGQTVELGGVTEPYYKITAEITTVHKKRLIDYLKPF